MRLIIAAIGKINPKSHEFALLEDYRRRLPWPVDIRELELKKTTSADKRKAAETALLVEAAKDAERRIILDERGKALTSRALAETLESWRNGGTASLAILIGGADGLDRSQLARTDLTLSFGGLTWPHMLARVMLLEQLYRCYTILNHHPYHRD